ncbi:MAG TPA: translocation/assembly module TamB domain-containing protein [Myxococcales bacterium]|nr:translocation/assembly module TamB domain-containing protein [Myxococcales bacterium]
MLLVAGGLLYLQSPAGADRVRRQVLSALQGTLQGQVEVGELGLRGDEIVLRGLKLYDPERRLVAEIAEVRLRVGATALLRRQVLVKEAVIREPRLYLVQDDQGLNLSRAIASKKEQLERTQPEERKPSRASFALQHLTIEGGFVSFVRQGEERDLQTTLDGLSGTGTAAWSGPDRSLQAAVDLRGRQQAPVQGDVQLDGRVRMEGEAVDGKVLLRAPGLELQATGGRRSSGDAQVEVKSARLDPRTAGAFVDRYPLQVPAQLSGTARLHGDVVEAALDGTAGHATVALRGKLDVKRLWSDGFTLTAREVDLSELSPDGPRTRLQLELTARGGGRTLSTLVGELKLNVPPSQVRGETVGPIQLSASADRGRFRLPGLRATLPGLSVEASGDGTLERLSVQGKVHATDLAELSRSLGRLRQGEVPALAGRGDLDFKLEGPVKRPGVSASGQLPQLRFQDNAVSDLKLTVDMPDVTRPLSAQASLQAAQVKVKGRDFRRVLAQVQSEGAEVTADARFTPVALDARGVLRETGELAAHLAGTRDQDSRGLLVRELTASYPEATWTLQRPARVAFRDGVSAEPLELHSGGQSLAVGGRASGGTVDVAAEVQRLDLKLLPPAFVDPKLNLAGLVSAKVKARGPWNRLEVEGEAELDGGRVRRFDALGLTVSGRYASDRAQGQLRFTSRLARVSARFDVPVKGLARRRHEPIQALIEVDEQPIATALAAAGRKENVTGTAGASLTVVGTADDPAARLSIRARNLSAPDYPQLRLQQPNLDVTVEAGQGGKLQARVEVEATGTAGEVTVRTPFRLDDLLSRLPHLPDKDALLAAAYEVDASFRDVPLEVLEVARVNELHGRASLRAELRGTLRRPVVNAHLEGHGIARGQAPPADLFVDVVADERDTAAAIRASRGSQVLADVTARVGAPLRDLASGAAVERVPLAVDGTVGPISLAEWIPPPAPEGDGEEHPFKAPSGQVAARLRGRGTLSDPRLELVSAVEQLRMGNSCIGRGTVTYRYQGAVSTVAAALTTSGKGRATVDGTLKLDLSLPALRQGVTLQKAPVEVALKADAFELGVLSGTLPRVRSISGKLSADARAQGTVDSLQQQGWVEWRDGALALDGYGDYRSIQLRAQSSGDAFKIDRLEARSGAGSLWLVASAVRAGDHFRLTGSARTEKFPVVYDDQMYAVLSARLLMQGDLTSKVVDLQEISIPEAHVELPDVKRKDLQDIDRPDDIVLVKRGRPVDRKHRAAEKEAEKAAKQITPAQAAAEGQGGSAGEGEGAAASRRYAFTLHAPRNLWIKSSDVNMEIGLSDNFRVEYDGKTRIFGDVRVQRGRAHVLGREFEVQRDSRITFGGAAKRPLVNVTAVHVNQREQVTVFMTVRGEGKDLTFKPSSQPALPESEIYTLLATGRRTLKRGSGASMSGADAASIIGSLAATQLKSALSDKLPLDVLSIESGGGEGLSGARLEVGTYLSDKAYLGGEVRLGADPRKGENTYGFRFEYQFTPRLSFQTEYGDARSGGADLIWSRDY